MGTMESTMSRGEKAPTKKLLGPSEQERGNLILEHMPQVRFIARGIKSKLPNSILLDDLISAGTIGLMDAVDKFDPSFNVKLKTYAEKK